MVWWLLLGPVGLLVWLLRRRLGGARFWRLVAVVVGWVVVALVLGSVAGNLGLRVTGEDDPTGAFLAAGVVAVVGLAATPLVVWVVSRYLPPPEERLDMRDIRQVVIRRSEGADQEAMLLAWEAAALAHQERLEQERREVGQAWDMAHDWEGDRW